MNTYEKDMSFHEFAMVLQGKQTCFFKGELLRVPSSHHFRFYVGSCNVHLANLGGFLS